MTHKSNLQSSGLIEANLPLYVQCLRMPADWRRAMHMDTPHARLALLAYGDQADRQDGDLLLVDRANGKVESYDPWEKRSEFFRLQEGDTDALLAFLRTVGYFGSKTGFSKSSSSESSFERASDGLVYSAEYQPKTREKHIWNLRRLFENSVRSGDHSGKHTDFPTRIITVKGNPRMAVTTTTFEDALALTLSIDAVRHAKRSKCARPDCGVPFTYTGGHARKFCTWYCGHIESVRKSRKLAKKAESRKGR
ncbi:MAG TPA: hypothetical protein VMB19_04285 [Silvibacterium sp.]|nr:hypothetical protein [Silvibacterium sp.]